jgi:Right handed beta helix region
LTNCTVTGNSAQFGGGIGVYGYNSAATLTNSTLTNNAAFGGGGAYASYDGSLTLVNCTVSANTSTNGGGIAAYHRGSLTLTNCTVSGNSGSRYGAGITVVNNSQGTLTNVTVSGNTAASGGGSGFYVLNSSTITLNNTIVAGNTNGDILVNQASSVSGSNNLIGTGGSGGLMNGINGNLVGVTNPLLAPLGNYGGPTQTMALLPGSPAIDAGNSSLESGTLDQRGMSYAGTVDIGAFESQGFTLTPVAGSTPQTTLAGNSFANPLGVTVAANNPVEPVNGGLINFTVPLSGPSATLTSTSSTIAGGQASVSATANTIVGGFNATASTTEGTTATFVLNNIIPLALTGLGGTVNYLQGGSPIQVAPALVVTQNLGLNITSATVLFSNLQIGDRINFSNPFGLQHSFLQSPDGAYATLTFSGASSAANYQATLRSVLFSCVATVPSTLLRSTAFTVTDTLANSASGSQTIGVTLVNQAPVLSGIETTPLTYIANYPTYPPQIITNTLSAFDADSSNLTSAKIQITSGYQNNSNSHDLLSFTPQFGLTSSFDSATGTLTLTGSTSLTKYRMALQSVTFSSSGPAANGTTRTISFTVYDDSTPTPLASNTVTRNVNMQLTVAPPTLSGLNGTTTFIKGGSAVPIASTIGVNQSLGLDLGGATVTFTNLQPGDRFDFYNQFALQRSLVYSPDGTSATLTLSGYATPAQYQTTLQSIIFWNVAGSLFTAPRTATFVVTDAIGQSSASGVQNFTVAPANQPPVLSGIEQTPLSYQANHPEFPPQPVTSTLLVTDPVSQNLTGATVQITSGYNNVFGGNDILSFVNQSGISGSFNATTGTLTLSGLSSVSNYRVALRSVTFSTFGPNTTAGTRVVTFTTFDDTTPTPLASNQVSRNVIVTTTNASPVLSGLSPVSLYVQRSAPLLFASSLQVADVDSPVLSGAVISFTSWQSGDRLSFYNQFALQHTFTEDLVAHTASLTITGPTSVANYQTMLQSIGYYSVAGLPSLATRNVSVLVSDGHSTSNTATGSIIFQPL